jgi:phenylacetic acid degradation protein paaN
MNPAGLFERHRERLALAREACRTRAAWSPFADQPGGHPGGEAARSAGEQAYRARLGRRYAIDGVAGEDWVGEEVSPYTQLPLGIAYRRGELDSVFAAAARGIDAWSRATIEQRSGVLLEIVDRLYRERVFELAHAVMHTTGQSFNMAYAGSGVNALDRGIEALVGAHDALAAIAPQALWERAFGGAQIRLEKHYRLVPRGVAVCFSCASFPTWNALPAMIASLATGNAVVVKPHPATVLPMAIVVEEFRAVLAACGFDADLVSMLVDTTQDPIGKRIVKHAACAIVDFTGGASFGQWVEQNAHPAMCFTETSGCNAVVLESCSDLDSVIRSLATTLCLFSAQMCTSPQNIYMPSAGVREGSGEAARLVPFDEVAQRLAAAVDAIGSEPRRAAAILAAIQSPATLELLDGLQRAAGATLLLGSRSYRHPEFPQARTRTPLMLSVTPQLRTLYATERFGPVSFVIRVRDAADALAQASADVRAGGALTAFVYSTDARFEASAEDAFARAGAQLTLNLTGPMPLNFAAAYSDYHVTGLNKAGNATLTDSTFIAGRFRIAQARRPLR